MENSVGTNQFKSIYLEMTNCIDDIKSDPKNIDNLESLRLYINRFFENVANCSKIEYTENIDKLFFGTFIQPDIKIEDFYLLIHNKEINNDKGNYTNFMTSDPFIRSYKLELDSKLFGEELGLNSYEIISLILFNIGSLINDNSSIKTIIKAIDKYCVENDKILYHNSSDLAKNSLLNFAIQSTLQDITSIFKKNNIENILNDSSVKITLDYYSNILGINFIGRDLLNGYNKLYQNISMFNNNSNELLTLSWALRNYFNFKNSLIPILHTLAKCKTLIASNLEKMSIKKLIFDIGDSRKQKDLSDLDVVMESSKLYKSLSIDLDKTQDTYNMILLKSQNNSQNDEDEFDNKDFVIEIIHSINQEMMNLNNCFCFEKSLSPIEKKQLNDMYIKFNILRRKIYKKASFYYKDITLYNKWNKQLIQ